MLRLPAAQLAGAAITAALATTTGFITPPAPATAASPATPSIGRDFADPSAIMDGKAYAYSTNSSYYGKLRHVPVQIADSPLGKYHDSGKDALPEPGKWVASTAKVWAPDVSRRADGSYLMYYTAADSSSKRQCVGAATSTSPLGPFKPTSDAPVRCNSEGGDALDSHAYSDSSGHWMLFKSTLHKLSTIFLQRMSTDGTTVSGNPVPVLSAGRADENGIVEAPFLLHHNGKYVLFYSGQWFNRGKYFENYAVSDSIDGPFTKAAGQWISKESTGGALSNPGGASVMHGVSSVMVLHADLPSAYGMLDPLTGYTQRAMFTGTLNWRGNTPLFELRQPGAPRDAARQ